MFNPNKRCLNLLISPEASCAYVYRDGVVLIQDRKIAIRGGEWATVKIANVFPCKIPFSWTGLPHDDKSLSATLQNGEEVNLYDVGPSRLVVSDCNLIAYGIRDIHIYYNNFHPNSGEERSQEDEQKDALGNMVVITTADGVVLPLPNIYRMTGRITVQPDPFHRTNYMSLIDDRSWKTSWEDQEGFVTVVHTGEKEGEAGKI